MTPANAATVADRLEGDEGIVVRVRVFCGCEAGVTEASAKGSAGRRGGRLASEREHARESRTANTHRIK